MTAPTLRQLLADVPREKYHERLAEPIEGRPEFWDWVADALLASPELAAIIDLAAEYIEDDSYAAFERPEVVAMLADWRANRAEQKPER